jgi:hypothetical protein
MASISYKVLGQNYPSPSVLTNLYTVPSGSGNYAIISTLIIANSSSLNDEIRVAVIPNGTAASSQSYIFYNIGISANATQTYTVGITLGQNDTIAVWSTNGTSSFNLFGTENS